VILHPQTDMHQTNLIKPSEKVAVITKAKTVEHTNTASAATLMP